MSYRISILFISNKSSPWLFKWQEPWWLKKGGEGRQKRRINMGQPSFQPGHFPPSFCLSNTALLPTSLETLSHTLPPASPELPTAICYKNFSVGPHVVWFLKSCSPFLTWSVGYWVVTGPLNDGRKIRHCRQCLVLINSVLSGPCTVVRAASYNCSFDASGNVLARSRLRDATFQISLLTELDIYRKRTCSCKTTQIWQEHNWPDQLYKLRRCWTPTWFDSVR